MRRRASALLVSLGAAVVGPGLSAPVASAATTAVPFTAAALPTWQTNGQVYVTATVGGLVFAGGEFSRLRPPGAAAGKSEIARSNFAVLDAATGKPTSCAPAFTNPAAPASATVRAMSVSPDGTTLYVAGYFGSAGGATGFHNVAAIKIATCAVVASFKPLPNAIVRAIAATSSSVFLGGAFTAVGSTPRTRLAAVRSADATGPGGLQTWAPTADKDVRALAISPDAAGVVVGGDFNVVNGTASHALAVVNSSTGASVRSYPSPFIPALSVVKALAVDESGFYTANEGTGGGVFDGRIAMNWNGYNERWRDTCLGATQALVVFKGVLYSGSHAHDCSSVGDFPDGARHHLLAEAVTGPSKLAWFPDTGGGIAEKIGPRAVTVSSTAKGDYLWSGGDFTSVNGVAQQGLTRFGTTDHSVGPASPELSAASPGAGVVRVAWRTASDLDNDSLTYRLYRDTFTTPIYTATASSQFWHRPQLSFVDAGLPVGSTHTYRITASDGYNTARTADVTVTVAAGYSPYAAQVLADGAATYLRYPNRTSNYLADSANDDDMTLAGSNYLSVSPGAVVGGTSSALRLTGSATTAFSEASRTVAGAFSLETWFSTTTKTGGQLIGFGNKQVGLSNNSDKTVFMTSNGQLSFAVNAGGPTTVTSPLSYNNGQWHHVVATQGAEGMALYVDGALVGANPVSTSQAFTGYWRIGGDSLSRWPGAPASTYFAGTVDETAIYGRALTAAAVANHYGLANAPELPGTGPVVPTPEPPATPVTPAAPSAPAPIPAPAAPANPPVAAQPQAGQAQPQPVLPVTTPPAPLKVSAPSVVQRATVTLAYVGQRPTCVARFTRVRSLRYVWWRDGKPVRGGQKRTLPVLRPAELGHRYACAVTASNVGGVKQSKSSALAVRPPQLRQVGIVRITGSAVVGHLLVAHSPTWRPSATRVTYRWTRDGVTITSPKGRFYRVSALDRGHVIAVVVTSYRVRYSPTPATARGLHVR